MGCVTKQNIGVNKVKWISVKDDMPVEDENALLYAHYKGYKFIVSGWWSEEDGWMLDGDYLCSEVTHWMPQPRPPVE